MQLARIDLYLKPDEKKKIFEAAKRLGKSVAWCMLHAFSYWLENNPAELNDLAEEFHDLREERDAKDAERDTGDFLGSFDKMEKKLQWIEEAAREGNIDERMKRKLIEQTKSNYGITQAAKRRRVEKRLKKTTKRQKRKSPKSDVTRIARELARLKGTWRAQKFLKKHGLTMTDEELMEGWRRGR